MVLLFLKGMFPNFAVFVFLLTLSKHKTTTKTEERKTPKKRKKMYVRDKMLNYKELCSLTSIQGSTPCLFEHSQSSVPISYEHFLTYLSNFLGISEFAI